MGETNKKLGLRNHARSPGSIANAEHHDPSRAHRGMDGIPGTYQESKVTNDALVHAVEDHTVLRVANDTGATVYVWVGAAEDVPGTVDATNGIAVLANSVEVIHCGAIDAMSSVAYKASAGIQIIAFDN